MIKPRSYNQDQAKMTESMRAEKEWLTKNCIAKGEEFTVRAIAFNAECRKVGALAMMVVEK